MHSSSMYEGSNKSMLNMLDGLMSRNVQPFIFLPKQINMSICDEFAQRGIPFLVLNFKMPLYPLLNTFRDFVRFVPRLFISFYIDFKLVHKISVMAKASKIDLIHSNVGPILLGFKSAKKNNIPHVWHLREYQDLDFKLRTLYSKRDFIKMINSPINHCIAISNEIYNHFSLNGDSKMIYNGVLKVSDIQFKPRKEKYFLYVGRLTEEKGVKILIQAFINFSKINSDYDLYLAGEYEENFKEVLTKICECHQSKKRVHFLGNRDDVFDLMSNATALIVPSLNEAFGRITVEAMFNGCLVIGNDSGGTQEILKDEELGLLYSGYEELALIMETVVSNGIESYYLTIKRAQERAIALYSVEQNAVRVYEYYKEILGIKD